MKKTAFKTRARRIVDPVVAVLDAVHVPPLLVSLFGLAFSLYGAMVTADGRLALGAAFLLIAGLCDVLDGDLARRSSQVSRFGAFIDSSLDRVTEFAYFIGIVVYIVNRPAGFSDFTLVVVLSALAGSILTSYARARAEGLGFDCKVGLVERPERVALLVVGLLLGYRVLTVVMVVLAVATLFTFLQRIFHVYRLDSGSASAPTVDSGAPATPGPGATDGAPDNPAI